MQSSKEFHDQRKLFIKLFLLISLIFGFTPKGTKCVLFTMYCERILWIKLAHERLPLHMEQIEKVGKKIQSR
jgi:hypothetical protein